MKNVLKWCLRIVLSILIFAVFSFGIESIVENSIRFTRVKNFTKKGVYQEDISTEDIKYYKVDLDLDKPGYTKTGNTMYPGYPGDILVTPLTYLDNDVLEQLMSFFVGGHAGICLGNYEDYLIETDDENSMETSGLRSADDYCQDFGKDVWNMPDAYETVLAFRPKNMDEEKRDKILSTAISHYGDPYNYNFTFDTKNKSYCSDLIYKVYKEVGCNLNKDGYWTTVHDLMVSNEVILTYYHYFDKNGVMHVYYAE
ncbi:MAG: hypothetical protein K6E20_05410 [Acholeplasmatales bacterium]|nr:hypothetical protein [Acholeplasmatales bacterium]